MSEVVDLTGASMHSDISLQLEPSGIPMYPLETCSAEQESKGGSASEAVDDLHPLDSHVGADIASAGAPILGGIPHKQARVVTLTEDATQNSEGKDLSLSGAAAGGPADIVGVKREPGTSSGSHKYDFHDPYPRKVYVKNLPSDISDSELHSLFSRYGVVEDAFVRRTPEGTSKGSGFVCFTSVEAAAKAIELGHKSEPLFLEVYAALPNPNRLDERRMLDTKVSKRRPMICLVVRASLFLFPCLPHMPQFTRSLPPTPSPSSARSNRRCPA